MGFGPCPISVGIPVNALGRRRAMERQGAMNLTSNRKWSVGLAVLALGAVSLGCALYAQDTDSGSGQPARAVRLSYVDGQVTLTQGGQAQQAEANTPLFEGTQLSTADDGKAEIQFEDGSVARIAPDSSLTLTVLQGSGSSANAVLSVNGGLAYFEFQGGGQAGQMAVQFGGAEVTTSGFSVFRVDVDNPPGQLAVFSGNAHLQGASGSPSSGVAADLHDGESITLSAGDPGQYNIAESIEPDSWDAWNSDRDQALTSEAANQTGVPAGVGASESPAWNDLDANGNWYDVPGQGYVWSPYDAANADFDPYGNGSWMWTPGFGYTWASGYPWGYLPFQCGMWNFYTGFGWGWAPGMGGCMPWWGAGYYRGPNVGYMPPGYRVVARPLEPRHPLHGRPLEPIIVANRNQPLNPGLPPRNRNTMATIGGRSVMPITTLAAHGGAIHPPQTSWMSNHGQAGIAGARPVTGSPGFSRPGYTRMPPANGFGPGIGHGEIFPGAGGSRETQNHTPQQPNRTYTQPGRSYSPPPVHNSPPAPHYTPPPAYHPPSAPSGGGFHGGGAPSGGGGGGGPHGGGGGGGGGSHAGGGGGGHR